MNSGLSSITKHGKMIPAELVIFLHNGHVTLTVTKTGRDLSDRCIRAVAETESGLFFWEQPRYIVVKWDYKRPVVSLCEN